MLGKKGDINISTIQLLYRYLPFEYFTNINTKDIIKYGRK